MSYFLSMRLPPLLLAWALGALVFTPRLLAETPPAKLELRDGDRVALLGAAYIERLQNHGYLETLLTAAHPDRHLVFRNLGWSGDTVEGVSRAVFGSPEDGFARLMNDVALTRPTLILVCYGDNEANRGEAGLKDFAAGLNRLLDALEKTGARLALVSPTEREDLGPPLPDPKAYNAALALYREALRTTAADRGLPYVELNPLVPREGNSPSSPADAANQLTANTLHLTPYGYWRTAPVVAARLGVPGETWRIKIDAAQGAHEASDVEVASLKTTKDEVSFEATDRRLPLPPPPPHAPEGADRVGPRRLLFVRGLAPGTYRLTIDGQPALTATAEELAQGVHVASGPQFEQAEALRRVIGEKNELFFHRHRPQNETYLFLFRKHEQGNNAVEIPQFDPLIEAKEKEIAALRQPQKHRYQLTRAN